MGTGCQQNWRILALEGCGFILRCSGRAGLAAEIGGGVVEMLLPSPASGSVGQRRHWGLDYCLGGPRALWSNLCPHGSDHIKPK